MDGGADPFVLIVLIGLGVWAFFLVAVPPHIYRQAWRNFAGSRSSHHRHVRLGEVKHFLDFAGGLLMIPILFVTLVGASLLVVNEYVARIPMMEEVIDAFTSDAVARERDFAVYMHELARREHGLDQVGAHPEAGLNSPRAATPYALGPDPYLEHPGPEQIQAPHAAGIIKDLWWQNMLPLAVCALLGGVFLYWFMFHYHVVAVERYYDGLLNRRGGRRSSGVQRTQARWR